MMPAMSRVTRTIIEEVQSGSTWRRMMRALRGALHAHGVDELGVAEGQRLGAGDARIGRPGGDGDGDDRVLDAGPERGDEGQRQDQLRHRQEDVGDAHQELVGPAAEIARDRADHQAERRGDAPRPAPRSSSVMRAPQTTREKMSRPSSSVPIQCSALGGSRRAPRFWPTGDSGAIHGAKAAVRIEADAR